MRNVQLSLIEEHNNYVAIYVVQRNNNTIILQVYVVTVNTFVCINNGVVSVISVKLIYNRYKQQLYSVRSYYDLITHLCLIVYYFYM